MKQTSLMCYQELKHEGLLGERQLVVYNGLKKFGYCSDRELTHFLGFKDPNIVRPRRNDLVKLGLIEEKQKDKCRITKRTAIIWGLKNG